MVSAQFRLCPGFGKTPPLLTESFTVTAPSLTGERITFEQAADLISERLVNIFRRDSSGSRPVFPRASPFQTDPHWKDLFLFYECFHGETGQGIGASHQTGWTALAANLVKRRYELTGSS